MEIIDLSNHPTQSVVQAAVKKAAEVLRAGGLVIYPTETVYGAGVLATNQAAVDKLLQYKSNRQGKPISIAVSGVDMAEKFVVLNQSAKNIYDRFLPGPVTVVSKVKAGLANGVGSEFGTVGVRIPDYALVNGLISLLNQPITATSANPSNGAAPYSITALMSQLTDKQKDLVDLVLDAGELPKRAPSTVIDTTLDTPIELRPGDLKLGANLENSEAIKSSSPLDTMELAGRILLKNINALATRGIIIGLDGELGAGKTVFTKGIAKYLGIEETITSPTFNYFNEYSFAKNNIVGQLIHVDAWRIDSPELLAEFKPTTWFGPGKICAIEWFSQVKNFPIFTDMLPQADAPVLIEIKLQNSTTNQDERQIFVAHSHHG